MDLLEFARGPALAFAVTVFVLGLVWRIGGVLRLPRHADLSPARAGAPAPARAALAGIVRGMWPRAQFGQTAQVTTLNGYVFHIGLGLVFFGYAPHIAFVRRYLGFGWPALPDMVMYLAAAATLLSLLLAMWLRLTDPVLKLISRPDDFISWTLTLLPVLTGMAVLSEPSSSLLAQTSTLYRTPLAVHLITLELLLIWLPFGKLAHALLFAFSRGATGMRFRHRGVPL